MAFDVPTGLQTIDLSQSANILNRRFMRQGLGWAVSGMRVFTPVPVTAAGKGVSVSRLPATWTMSNSWEKAFRAWNKQQMEAVEDSGSESAVARFRDFKIHMDVTHINNGFGNNLLPVDDLGTQPLTGEWESSQIVIPNVLPAGADPLVLTDPKEYRLHAVGVAVNGGISRGLIEGYAASRAYPQSPDPASPQISGPDNWLRQMFDVGNDTSEILDNATDRNDDLPYDQQNYPGGQTQLPHLQLVDAAYFSAGTNSNKLYLKGDTFPCGLVRINNASDVNINLLIDLVPGHHKGYLCQPMQDM